MAKHGKKKATKATFSHGWYYMGNRSNPITVVDIKGVLDGEKIETEIWPEAGVLEVVLGEKESMDIEECELDLRDDYSNEYLKEAGTTSLFYISFKTEIDDKCQEIMKKIVQSLGGRICGDTPDFTPVILSYATRQN